MKILFIDDLRQPYVQSNELTIARTYDEAITALKNNVFDYILFDHDLGEQKSGYDIAKYIVENAIPIHKGFYVHSQNIVGKMNIEQLLIHYGYKNIYP